MSVATEIKRLSTNIKNALTALTEKGVDVPTGANSNNLAELISTIETGGGGAEVKTCAVSLRLTAAAIDSGAYMKYEDGEITCVQIEGSTQKITLENVVCDSVLWVNWIPFSGEGEASLSGDISVIGGCCFDQCFHVEKTATECSIAFNSF